MTAKKETKIPVNQMDAVDRQQQDDIDSARNLAKGALLTCVTITVLNFGVFVFALWEMGRALDAVTKLAGQ